MKLLFIIEILKKNKNGNKLKKIFLQIKRNRLIAVICIILLYNTYIQIFLQVQLLKLMIPIICILILSQKGNSRKYYSSSGFDKISNELIKQLTTIEHKVLFLYNCMK